MKPDFTITKVPREDPYDFSVVWELHYRDRKQGITVGSENIFKYNTVRARFLDKGILLPHMSAPAWEVCISEAMRRIA